MKRCIPLSLAIAALAIGLSACDYDGYEPNDPGRLVPRTVDEDASLPSISVNGTKLHAETFGDPQNPILIVIHGGPGADYRYLLNCRAFAAQGYFVVFYDQRGAGLSQRHPKSLYTLKTPEDDLGAVIRYYRRSPAQRVFLLGHSWGGMLAAAFVNSNPTVINGLIVGEPGGLVWKDVEDYITRSRDFGLLSETLNNATYVDQFFTGRKDQHQILDYKFALLTATDGTSNNPVGNEASLPYWRAGAVTFDALYTLGDKLKPDWTTNLSQFRTRVLFVYSQNNRAYGEAHARKVSGAFPNVQLERIDDAGHDMISFPRGFANFFPVALTYLNGLR
jgi:proline iminopeptidase